MSDNYCIALQPICDRDLNHVADELLYRSGVAHKSANISDAMMATARACNVAFYEVGIEKLIGQRQIFFNAPRDWIVDPTLMPPNAEQVVVEVLENVVGDAEVIEALATIRRLGYAIALDDFILNDQTSPLLQVATIVKIDAWQDFTLQDVFFYKNKGIKLLAEKVEEVEDFERLRELGFDYFQGYFYAKPQLHQATSRQRSSNQAAQIRILAALNQEFVDYQHLEQLIVQDPHLTFMLLKYTNSAYFGRFNRAVTVQQALTALGLRQVRTIVMTVMLANNGPASRLLLPCVLTRASMCYQVAQELGTVDPELAFMVGMLSQMDLFMGMPLSELLKQLQLTPEEMQVILKRTGELGCILNTVEAFEKAQTRSLNYIDARGLNELWLNSRVWVEETLKSTLNY